MSDAADPQHKWSGPYADAVKRFHAAEGRRERPWSREHIVMAGGLIRRGGEPVRWIIAGTVVLIIFALTVFFVLAARVIQRDMKRRFRSLGTGIEREANSLLAGFLHSSPPRHPPADGSRHSEP